MVDARPPLFRHEAVLTTRIKGWNGLFDLCILTRLNGIKQPHISGSVYVTFVCVCVSALWLSVLQHKKKCVLHKLTINRNLLNFTLSNKPIIVILSVSCLLLQTESSGFVLRYLHVCTDGEDNWRTSYGSLSVQPCHDQLCHHPDTRQPERRGEAAVDVSGSQLDTPTVSTCVYTH